MTEVPKLLYSEVSPFEDGEQYKPGSWRRVPGIVHDEQNIKGFFGSYRWLSNFGPATIVLDGVAYDGVERAYQAAKWPPADRSFFTDCSNEESITYNREHKPNLYTPDEWDAIKLGVMCLLQFQKYDTQRNSDNAVSLIETGKRYLEETNWWNDTYWGKNLAGEGINHLGKLIMKVRSTILDA